MISPRISKHQTSREIPQTIGQVLPSNSNDFMKQLRVMVNNEKVVDKYDRVSSRLHKQEIQCQTLELKLMTLEDPYSNMNYFNLRMKRYNDELLM